MSQARIDSAAARIDAALARIAASAGADAADATRSDAARLAEMTEQHERLREEVSGAIGAIDTLVTGIERAAPGAAERT